MDNVEIICKKKAKAGETFHYSTVAGIGWVIIPVIFLLFKIIKLIRNQRLMFKMIHQK